MSHYKFVLPNPNANIRYAIRYNETMANIEIQKVDGFPDAAFDVTVSGNTVTAHRVRFSREYYEELTASAVTAEELVEESFEFMLAREPNTSILSEFDLKEISRYFPAYEQEMKNKFRSS